MVFKDTHLCAPAANFFNEHGVYTKLVPETTSWYNFWDEERRRCLEGYTSSNGIQITGYHYFYLNYYRIQRAVETTVRGRKIKRRESMFPRFYDGDYEFYWLVDICRYGISKEQLASIGLNIDIHPDDIHGGKDLVVLKARRKGYSYKLSSMLGRNYYFLKESNNFAFAFDKKYLEGDGIYQKFLDGMAFIDDNTAFTQPKLVDRAASLEVKSGYKINENGTDIVRGTQNLVMGISLKDNPDGARGKAGEIVMFEEMGKFPGLKTAWDITSHTVHEGEDDLGIMFAFGTGGTEGADFDGAEELFFNPKENGCIRINNKWDDGADGTWCGYFVPVYRNLPGYMDADGNSLEQAAIANEMKIREEKKQSKRTNTYSQYIAELPFNPREAVLAFDINILPTQELLEQRNSVEVHKRWTYGTPGDLYLDKDGKAKFKPNLDRKPVLKFPHTKEDSTVGCPVIYEAPVRVNGEIPAGLYVACHDPYAQDGDGVSLGSTYIIKRTNNFSPTLNDCIVASYVGRPSSQDEYNRTMFMLLEFYNAKLGFENDRGDVVGYARRYKKLHYLHEQFSFLDKKELQGQTKRAYGMNMTKARKEQGEIYLRDWLLTPLQTDEDGNQKLILNTIVDPALLDELIKFNYNGNFDRAMSLIIGMYFLKEVHNKQVQDARKQKHEDFFNRFA